MDDNSKSAILNKYDKDAILNKEQKSLSSEKNIEQSNNSNKLQDEEKVNNLEKAKELLQKLLKESLDKSLTLCEKHYKNHNINIKNVKEINDSLTKLVIRMNKQIQEKIKKEKEKERQLKLKNSRNIGNRKGFSPRKSAISNTRTNFYRAKTPSHINKGGNNLHSKTPLMGSKRDVIKNRANIGEVKNSRTVDVSRTGRRVNARQKKIGNKLKSSYNFKKYISPNDSHLDELQTISVTSIKTNKTNTTTLNTISNSKINNKYPYSKISIKNKKANTELTLKPNLDKTKITNQKRVSNFNLSEKNLIQFNNKKIKSAHNSNLNSGEKKKRKKTPFKKKNNDNESVKINSSNNKKKEKSTEDEIDDILSMECKLQKETGLKNDDPLLILPLKDLDFVPEILLRRNSTRNEIHNKEKKYYLTSFNIIENLDKIKFNKNIFNYLSLNDLLSIKNLSKKFHELIILYLREYLEKEEKTLSEVKNNLNIKEPQEREGIEHIELSKGSKKAAQMLNEAQLNHLFKEDKIPTYDIILIYRIYFQIINHPLALIAKTDLELFWEKCKLYFITEQNGKTGNILVSMINKKKIEINKNNLYKIYKLVKGNLDKIAPNYFSNICGTTGLFVFIIKDILEFLGISQKIKKKENAYWTYSDIIEAINDKSNYFKNINI